MKEHYLQTLTNGHTHDECRDHQVAHHCQLPKIDEEKWRDSGKPQNIIEKFKILVLNDQPRQKNRNNKLPKKIYLTLPSIEK